MAFLLTIPIPPSVNAMYTNRRGKDGKKRGRRKSKRYLAWQDHAQKEIMIQRARPVKGRFKIFISMPKVRADPDNLVKPILDVLKNMSLIQDDSQNFCSGIHVEHVPDGLPDRIVVSVEDVLPPHDVETAQPVTG